MLAIRMQRTGRKGHAQFRVVVQDSRRTPTSGKIVAQLGSYNPHSKQTTLDKEKAQFYLDHGAQPSERVVRLLVAEGVKPPKWVRVSAEKQRSVRNADKRRSTAPAPEAPAEAPAETESAESAEAPVEAEAAPEPAEAPAIKLPTETAVETAATETADEPAAETASEPTE